MLDELLFRYKAMSLVTRLLLVLLICGALPWAYLYILEVDALEQDLELAKSGESSERQRLGQAKERLKNLPALEEKLAFTTEQLKKTETLLPRQVDIDRIVEQVSKTAKDRDVRIRLLRPDGVATIPGDYPYDEVRFEITMIGSYANLGGWINDMAGHHSKAYVKTWELRRDKSVKFQKPVAGKSLKPALGVPAEEELNPREKAQKVRDDMRIQLTSDLVYYRVASAKGPESGAATSAASRPGSVRSSTASQSGGATSPVGSTPPSIVAPPSPQPPSPAPPTPPGMIGPGGPSPTIPSSQIRGEPALPRMSSLMVPTDQAIENVELGGRL
jgi:Tfp pilus assembly protein PilO